MIDPSATLPIVCTWCSYPIHAASPSQAMAFRAMPAERRHHDRCTGAVLAICESVDLVDDAMAQRAARSYRMNEGAGA